MLLRIDGKFTASIPLLIKSSLMKCVLASVLKISLQTGLNNQMNVSSRLASQVCRPNRIVFLTTQEIHFHQYFDSLGTDDTGLCRILFMSIRVQFSHHT